MAKKKIVTFAKLSEYDTLFKNLMLENLSKILARANTHTNEQIASITDGTKVAAKATQADSATASEDANKLGGQLPSYYAKATDIPTGSLAKKNTVSESDLDSNLAEKVNAASEGNHSHSNKNVLDEITSAKVSKWDSAEANSKSYTDKKVAEIMENPTEAVDSIYELRDAMNENGDAIGALTEIAASKVPTTRKINGKALSDDITLSASDVSADPAGSASAVQANLNTHSADTTKHIASTERTNWNAAKTHADSAHAPSNAQENVVEIIKVNGVAQTVTNKAVNIAVPQKPSDIGAAESVHGHAITDVTNLQTILNNASSAISTNISSINTHTEKIGSLEEKVGEGLEEVTSEEIQSLFS